MTKFVDINQDGKIGKVNPDNVLLVLPAPLIGETQIVLINGMALNVKGSVSEITDRLEGKDPVLFQQ